MSPYNRNGIRVSFLLVHGMSPAVITSDVLQSSVGHSDISLGMVHGSIRQSYTRSICFIGSLGS